MALLDWLFGKPWALQAATLAQKGAAIDGADDDMRHMIKGPGAYDFDIVGESNYQDILIHACGGRCEDGHEKRAAFTLVPEPSNPYDPNAIRVDLSGHVVGYLAREDAREYQEALKAAGIPGQPVWCFGHIVGGWECRRANGDTSVGAFGVKLDMDVPPEFVHAS